MEETPPSSQLVFLPGRGRKLFYVVLCVSVGTFTGWFSQLAYSVSLERTERYSALSFCIVSGILSLACWFVVFRHLFFTHRLKLCIDRQSLAVYDFFKSWTVDILAVTAIAESLDRDEIVIKTKSKTHVIFNYHFADDYEKERFLKILKSYTDCEQGKD
jgi:hypothetical protein